MPIFDHRTPTFLYVLPMLLLLFGMTSYLGLRTAGNFSMFSNLRTEGAKSNHIILGYNQLKIWRYQEDTVRLLKPLGWVRRGIRYSPYVAEGMELPAVEVRKSLWALKGADIGSPIVFEYRGKIFDVAADDAYWHPARRNWEMSLFEFRPIQPTGPNKCRW